MLTKDEVVSFKNSLEWKTVLEEIEKMIATRKDKLVSHCDTRDELVRLQESIKALQFCAQIPQMIEEREA